MVQGRRNHDEPAPYGLKTTENQWISILLNQQVDINTATCSIMLPSYKTTDQLKCAGFAVTFFGSVMLANPKLGLKTVRDYAKGGATFEEALRSALEPLVGQTVYVPAAVSEKEFNEVPFKLAGLDLPAYVTMDDAQMLLLAKSGRLDFMHPGGAPIAQTLLDAGWTPVYDTGQLLEFGPGGVNSPLESLVFNNGWGSTADYINSNQTTMMRFASVVFRIFDELKEDPSLYGVYAPYLNSVAGTSLDADGVRRTVENLDPFVPFEEQTKYFVDKASPEYYGNSMGALIKALETSGTIPAGITPDHVVWAAQCITRCWTTRTRRMLCSNRRRARSLPMKSSSCSTRRASTTTGTTSWTPTGWPPLRRAVGRFAADARARRGVVKRPRADRARCVSAPGRDASLAG